MRSVAGRVEIAALTRSEHGSVIVPREGAPVVVEASPVDAVIDTTGAGDLYAAGFLYGLTHGFDLARSAPTRRPGGCRNHRPNRPAPCRIDRGSRRAIGLNRGSSGRTAAQEVPPSSLKACQTRMTVLRNLAIIAHVDHGKTTLIDALLQQSGAVRAHQQLAERAMDSNDLERERGITILAKCTAVAWKDYRLNIVDTPGHADFGGEVERILDMVDGALLLVDSAESVRPQTKFVLSKALAKGLRPIVVVNKMDRPDARPDTVLDEVFDLFAALGADEHQLDFPVAYASGRSGWASMEPVTSGENLHPLLDLIVAHVPAPDVDREAPFTMLATMIESDPYIGRVLTGRVASGVVKMKPGRPGAAP